MYFFIGLKASTTGSSALEPAAPVTAVNPNEKWRLTLQS